jgi:hypothetical protein
MNLRTSDAELVNTAIRSGLPKFALQPSHITYIDFSKSCCATLPAREEVHDFEARADRVWTIKESLLSKRDSHKNSSGSNASTRNPNSGHERRTYPLLEKSGIPSTAKTVDIQFWRQDCVFLSTGF